MIHKTLVISLGFFSLLACQNQTAGNHKNNSTETVTNNTSTNSSSPMKNTEPEMSVGLPPDKAAEKQAQAEQGNNKNQSNIIYFNEGENKFLKEYEMNVTFKKLTEDSRCPEGVNCIWAGVATAEIELMGLATRPQLVKISTMTDANRGYSKSQNFNGLQISLTEVTPSPTSEKTYNNLKGKYRIGLQFTKDNSAQNSTTTK